MLGQKTLLHFFFGVGDKLNSVLISLKYSGYWQMLE